MSGKTGLLITTVVGEVTLNSALVRAPFGMVTVAGASGVPGMVQVTWIRDGAASCTRTRTRPFPRCSSTTDSVNGAPGLPERVSDLSGPLTPSNSPSGSTCIPFWCNVSLSNAFSSLKRPAGSVVMALFPFRNTSLRLLSRLKRPAGSVRSCVSALILRTVNALRSSKRFAGSPVKVFDPRFSVCTPFSPSRSRLRGAVLPRMVERSRLVIPLNWAGVTVAQSVTPAPRRARMAVRMAGVRSQRLVARTTMVPVRVAVTA